MKKGSPIPKKGGRKEGGGGKKKWLNNPQGVCYLACRRRMKRKNKEIGEDRKNQRSGLAKRTRAETVGRSPH